jgi:hypothetical protein
MSSGSIVRYRETLSRWGLSDVPFRAAHPDGRGQAAAQCIGAGGGAS